MRAFDTHYHWYPTQLLEQLCKGKLAAPVEDGYALFRGNGRVGSKLHPIWTDLDGGLEISQQATGDETAVLCTLGLFAGVLEKLPPEIAVETAQIYNEVLAETQDRYRERFYGAAYVPLMDTGEAINTLDHAIKELGLCAVNLPSSTSDGAVDSTRLDDFYSRVAELRVPLIVHPDDTLYRNMLPDYDGAIYSALGRVLDSSVTVLRLIFSGVLERHPDLNIIHTHAGGLLPGQAGRIDKNSIKSSDVTSLTDPPSAFIERMFVDTVAPRPLTLRTAIDFYGIDHVLYGTDHPCWSPAQAIKIIDDANLSQEEREAILWKNAETLLPIGRI